MDLGLSGKNAIVTGGSKGIGRSIALGLASEGANIVICARGQEALDATVKELEAFGVKAYAESCDVSDTESLNIFFNAAKESLGSVDILINNTSGLGISDDEAGWKSSVDIDLMATVRATQLVTPWMAEAGGGSILHISSISALEAGPPPYSTIKAALIAHAKSMALSLAGQNIRVNCIAPGSIFVEGGIWDMIKQNDPDMYNGTLSNIPFGRMGTPEEVANAAVFLASSRASWISGATLVVDGVQHKGIF